MKKTTFQPDYRHFEDVMRNHRPKRLPLYEHIIKHGAMTQVMGTSFESLLEGDGHDLREYFRNYCGFFKKMTYDVVSFEVCISEVFPGGNSIAGGRGVIQNRRDFSSFPWEDIPRLYWERASSKFDALEKALPEGMKAVGGPGNGVFELSEALVGMEYLPYIQVDDPELYADLYRRIGDTMHTIWTEFLRRYAGSFSACRFGDDLGFKSSLLTNPSTLRDHVFPLYRRIIDLVHGAGVPFLLHSCGCIFEVMDDLVSLGIDAKHSNEDAIAPFDRWISDYGEKIALLGGFDMDFLCARDESEVYSTVLELGTGYRSAANGYALGSGNSIPDYVPVENYLAMVRAAQTIRDNERSS